MSEQLETQSAEATQQANHQTLTRYYQFHSKIYDATRWSFLFGRDAIIDSVASRCRATKILEVGCGTGKNLRSLLDAFPEATVTGVDVSGDMLAVARQNLAREGDRVTLLQEPYQGAADHHPRYDLILFSYALTMFNPGWEEAIVAAHNDLIPNGTIAVVDFHASPFRPFERWMGVNHVRMDGHLLPKLKAHFSPLACDVAPAYGGLWQYFLFVGRK